MTPRSPEKSQRLSLSWRLAVPRAVPNPVVIKLNPTTVAINKTAILTEVVTNKIATVPSKAAQTVKAIEDIFKRSGTVIRPVRPPSLGPVQPHANYIMHFDLNIPKNCCVLYNCLIHGPAKRILQSWKIHQGRKQKIDPQSPCLHQIQFIENRTSSKTRVPFPMSLEHRSITDARNFQTP